MRGIAFLIVLLSMVAIALAQAPYVGVYLWSWLVYMSPQKFTWGAEEWPVVQVAALVTLASFVLSKEPKKVPMDATTWLILLFVAWMTMTNYFSLDPNRSWSRWDTFFKDFVMVFMIIVLINKKVRLHGMLWIIVVSIGFFGAKGGAFTIQTGGQYQVLGPPQSIIYDKNHLATAILMAMPIMIYLRNHSANPWLRHALLGTFLLSLVAVIGGQSRGAVLGLGAVAVFYWWRSAYKIQTLVLGAIIIVPTVLAMPPSWYAHIATIGSAEDDNSFQGRLDAWQYAINVSLARPLVGGGIASTEDREAFQQFHPDSVVTQDRGRAAHSIYFQVLGDLGFIALAIWLLIFLVAWNNARWIIRHARDRPDLAWTSDLARMIQVSLVAYVVAGAALSLAYYSLYFSLVVVLAIIRRLVARELAASQPARRPFGSRRAAAAPAGASARLPGPDG